MARAPSGLSALSPEWLQRVGVRGILGAGDLPNAAGFEEVANALAFGSGQSTVRRPAQSAKSSPASICIPALKSSRPAYPARVASPSDSRRLGFDCTLSQICAIGAGATPGAAKIGDHVYIAPHSCILGPVTIGDGATIAARSLVLSDVPGAHTAMGVPAWCFKIQSSGCSHPSLERRRL